MPPSLRPPDPKRDSQSSWWKAKLKEEDGSQDGPVGLIPCTYVEEVSGTMVVVISSALTPRCRQ